MAGGVRGTEACVARGVRGRRPCMAGGRGGACVAGETANAADGTDPTGMHSCYYFF